MWGFVFRLTIPLFWIPAHTVTFLLPTQYRTLFAALLSVVLGILLGIAERRNKEEDYDPTHPRTTLHVSLTRKPPQSRMVRVRYGIWSLALLVHLFTPWLLQL